MTYAIRTSDGSYIRPAEREHPTLAAAKRAVRALGGKYLSQSCDGSVWYGDARRAAVRGEDAATRATYAIVRVDA